MDFLSLPTKFATTDVVVTSLIIVASTLFIRVIRQWYRLSHIPGPSGAGFSKYWMIREAVKGRQPQAIKKINDQYGSLVRIGPNELVTNDPDVLRRIMSSRSAYERGPWYDGFRLDPTRDHTFSMRDDAAHSILRNKVSAGYSGKENMMMEEAIESQVAKFVDFIESRYISDPAKYRPMELSEKIQFYTLDVIGELAFGKEFGYMKEDRDIHEYLKMLNDSVPVMLILANLPWMAKVLQSPVFRTLFPKEGDKLGFGAFIGWVKSSDAPSAS
jgi:cytochrome P450